MNSLEKRILIITMLGHSLCHINILIFAAALRPIQQSLGVSLTQLTAIGTAGYLVYGLGALPAGFLATRTSAKRTLMLFFTGTASAALVTGLAKSLPLFSAGLVCLGFFSSFYHVSGLSLIAQSIRQRGKAMGLHGVAGSAGVALAPFIAGLTLQFHNDWHLIYIVAAAPAALAALLLLFDHHIPDAHPEPVSGTHDQDQSAFPVRIFIMVLLIMGINGLVYRGFMTTLPIYIQEHIHFSGASRFTAGLVTTAILGIGMIGQYLGGHLSDRIRPVYLYLIIIVLSLPWMALMGVLYHVLFLAAAALFSLIHFSMQPVENHLIAALVPSRVVGSGYGWKFIVTFGVGSLATLMAGYISETISMSAVFLALSGLIFLCSLAALLISRLAE